MLPAIRDVGDDRVLATHQGGFQALGLIKALRAVARIRVLVADVNEENVARYFADAFFRVPSLKAKQIFEDFIVDLCEREGVTTIFASTEHELELLADHRNVFAAGGATVYVSDRQQAVG